MGRREALHRLRQDIRVAGRQLARAPGFALVAVLALGLGIGSSTALFSAARPILFEPLPYPRAERLVTVWDVAADGSPLEVTFGTFREFATRSRSFEALAVARPWQPTLNRVAGAAAAPERVDGQRVSTAYFRTLGVTPALGRSLDAADDRPGGARTVVLSDRLWRRRFAADSGIVGRALTLGDVPHTVVGVMPPTFENVLLPSAEVWTLLQYDPALPPQGREWGHHLHLVARLRPDVGPDEAGRELDRIARTPVSEFARASSAPLDRGLLVRALRDDVTRGVRPAILAALGAVALLLAIACVNVTNLLLARGAARRGEFATRAALGAGRARLVRQLLVEHLLLALAGGTLGVGIAALGVRAIVALAPPGLPRLDAIRVDGAVLAFALGVTLLVGVAFGTVPALVAARTDLHTALGRGGRRIVHGSRRARRALVVTEVALAAVLLVSAGLLLRSMRVLLAVPPGFDPAHVLTLQVPTSGSRFDDAAVTRRYFEQAVEAVRRVPGVTAAGLVSQLPLSGEADAYGVRFAGRAPAGPGADAPDRSVLRYAISPGYLEAMGIPLRAGRALRAGDASPGAPGAVLINESLARRAFRGRDAVGERLRMGGDENPEMTIVGVVGDVRHTSLATDAEDAVYLPSGEIGLLADRTMWLAVRGRGDAAALTPAVRTALWAVDADQPIVRVATMGDRIAASMAARRFLLTLFEAFAGAALALAAIGLYGVLAGSVVERVREIGVRAALGATRRDLLVMVVRQGAALAAVGVALGVAGAVFATRPLTTFLFGVTALDPWTYAAVAMLLLVVSCAACAVPGWRAAQVAPTRALRAE
jgi:predicted permease